MRRGCFASAMVSVSACSPYGSLQGRVSGISWRTGVQVLVSWQFLGGGESCQSGKISFTVSQSLYPGPVGCVGGRIRGILAANLRGAAREGEDAAFNPQGSVQRLFLGTGRLSQQRNRKVSIACPKCPICYRRLQHQTNGRSAGGVF
jgi:hypothetical protein